METHPIFPTVSYGTISSVNNNVREEVKHKIVTELIEPTYYGDIKHALSARNRWKIAGHVCETVSKLMIAASGILSFASGYYSDLRLGFYAGSTSTISLACLQFASYCFRENKSNADEANILLQSIKIDTLPVVNDDTMEIKS
jgi:hypothetical protein